MKSQDLARYIEDARTRLPDGISYLENVSIAPPGYIQIGSGGPLFHTYSADGGPSGTMVLYLTTTAHPGYFFGLKFETDENITGDSKAEYDEVERVLRHSVVDFQRYLSERFPS